jgi:hypothetical protein
MYEPLEIVLAGALLVLGVCAAMVVAVKVFTTREKR